MKTSEIIFKEYLDAFNALIRSTNAYEKKELRQVCERKRQEFVAQSIKEGA